MMAQSLHIGEQRGTIVHCREHLEPSDMERVTWRSSCVTNRNKDEEFGLCYSVMCSMFKSSVFSALVDESVLLILFL